jgi:autophagy-related protein 101
MNARSQIFEFTLEDRQINETLASIFHTVLFHRSLGKFIYSGDSSYSVGTIGTQDIDCDFIDFTYVCCSSPSLDRAIKKEISVFSEQLRSHESAGAGQISLEFFQKKKNRWPFQPECIPWEVWTIRLDLLELNNEDERQIYRERVGDMLTEKILYITEVMNRHDYVPKMPAQTELDLIFDTTHTDVQPYLFKFTFSTSAGAGASSSSVKSTMQKIIKETLSL